MIFCARYSFQKGIVGVSEMGAADAKAYIEGSEPYPQRLAPHRALRALCQGTRPRARQFLDLGQDSGVHLEHENHPTEFDGTVSEMQRAPEIFQRYLGRTLVPCEPDGPSGYTARVACTVAWLPPRFHASFRPKGDAHGPS